MVSSELKSMKMKSFIFHQTYKSASLNLLIYKKKNIQLVSSTVVQVHMCNKLASRHVRVGLADPIAVPRCDICENEPAFFYCETDGSSLCLQCDMLIHVGSKRNHARYLFFRQRVEFPGDNASQAEELNLKLEGDSKNKMGLNQSSKPISSENQENNGIPKVPNSNATNRGTMFDLNVKPQKNNGEGSNHQEP
ncbi:hypothetical protein AgCh_031007 [Apium graveolens]